MKFLTISILHIYLFFCPLIAQLNLQIYSGEILVALVDLYRNVQDTCKISFGVWTKISSLAAGHSCPLLFIMLLFSKSVSCKVRNVKYFK